VNAITVVEDEVRELVRRRGRRPAAVRRLVDEVIAEYDDRSLTGSLPQLADPRLAARRVFDAVAGFGPLQKYLDDPTVEEIWINERLTAMWAAAPPAGRWSSRIVPFSADLRRPTLALSFTTRRCTC